ncbi:LamB/YcsF family protein [bacterium]|nr:LamB/YcsF family protein [bacterium]
MIKINCDIGERGPDNAIDKELMCYVQIANIACGGHAGDVESVRAFRELAREFNVAVSGHLSYPDRENFGRVSMDMPIEQLLASLTEQHEMMSDIKMIKFHGALYNDACINKNLSGALAAWLSTNGITEIITPAGSELAKRCAELNIKVIPEAFAERAYSYSPETGQLSLVNRSKDYACIHDCETAVANTDQILNKKQVNAYVEEVDGSVSRRKIPIEAETVCIHSDSDISLELAKRLSSLND